MKFFSVNDTNKLVVDHAIGVIREMVGERDALLQEETIVMIHDMTPESDEMVDGVLAGLVDQGLPMALLHDIIVKFITGDNHVYVVTERNGDGTVTGILFIFIKIFVDPEPGNPGIVNFAMRTLVSDLLVVFERYGMIDPLGKKHDKVMIDIHERLKKTLVTSGVFEHVSRGKTHF